MKVAARKQVAVRVSQQITITLQEGYPGPAFEDLLEQALRIMWGRVPETFTWHYSFFAERAIRAVCEAIIRDGPPEFPLNVAMELPRDRVHHRVADPSKVIFVNLCRG